MNDKAIAAVKHLDEVNRIDKLVKTYTDQLEKHQNLIKGLRSVMLDDVGGSRGTRESFDKFGEALDALIEYEQKLNDAICALMKIKTEAFEIIEALPKLKYKELLTARYLQRKTAEKVAEELNEDYRNVYRQINKALEAYYDIMEKNTESDTECHTMP